MDDKNEYSYVVLNNVNNENKDIMVVFKNSVAMVRIRLPELFEIQNKNKIDELEGIIQSLLMYYSECTNNKFNWSSKK